MAKKTASIPLHTMPDEFGLGIAIAKASIEDLDTLDEINQVHRDEYHVFFIQQKGTIRVEVDFQEYTLTRSSVGYIKPFQVHRVVSLEDVSFYALMINSENLNPEYAALLQSIGPGRPLTLQDDAFLLLTETASVCVKLFERKDEKLHHSLLKDCCNALVGLIVSHYIGQHETAGSVTRYEIITKAFKEALERSFIVNKQPSHYAQSLNISTAYLNECIKAATGFSVSYHIRQRVILEAKRLLYHSGKSVKEIANDLGYDDYPYFSKLFSNTAGMSALSFRNKNRD